MAHGLFVHAGGTCQQHAVYLTSRAATFLLFHSPILVGRAGHDHGTRAREEDDVDVVGGVAGIDAGGAVGRGDSTDRARVEVRAGVGTRGGRGH